MPALSLCLSLVLAASLGASGAPPPCAEALRAAGSLQPPGDPTGARPLLLVGQSAPLTGPHAQAGVDARAGLGAALAVANETSAVTYALATLDDAYSDEGQAHNVDRLLCGGAFAVAGTVGSSASERALERLREAAGSDGVPVPFVGALSSSQKLRDRSGGRAGVALVRAGGGDEMGAIVAHLLAREWAAVNSTALFFQDTQFGRDALRYLNRTLGSLGAELLASYGHPVVDAPGDLVDMARRAVGQLCARGDPRAVVLVALGSMSGALLREMARQRKGGVTYVAMAWVTASELHAAVPPLTWEALAALGSSVYMSQVVPMPTNTTAQGPDRDDGPRAQYRIVREYQKAMAKYQPGMNLSHASLEGFIAGRLLTAAASRALELNGWPLTRATFLDAIFRDIRTFQLYDYTLGPYGDGVGSREAGQTGDDWCNQGAHEVFMTQMNLSTGQLDAVPSWSFRFSGCSDVGWNSTSHRALVGVNSPPTADYISSCFALGLRAAASAHNSAHDREMAVTASQGSNTDSNLAELTGRGALAIAGSAESELGSALAVVQAGKMLIAPRSGLKRLREHRYREVINLFASYYQEARTAASFLFNRENASTVIALWNSATHHDAGKDIAEGLNICYKSDTLLGVNKTLRHVRVDTKEFSNATEVLQYASDMAVEGAAFIVVASADDAWLILQSVGPRVPVVLASVVSEDDMFFNLLFDHNSSRRWRHVYRTSLAPLLSMLSSGNALRRDFESWVSYGHQLQEEFEGFLAGRFLSAVLESVEDVGPGEDITTQALLKAVYTKKYFKIDNKVTVGPFLDRDSGEKFCNQGLDTVYVTKWSRAVFDYEPFSISETQRCGREFDPSDIAKGNSDLTVILCTTIPGFAVVCLLLVVAIAVRRRGRATLQRIRRSELEIGERIGKGQLGTVHNGDWHGTPVAIRVIDKTAVTREDLDAVKSEMALTHSLHHPNLLMLLGYSESKTDLLIVSEYMASGSLHEYLKNNKQNMNYYNEVAIAFLDGSMVTKICDFWCSKGKSSNSSRRHAGWLAPELVEERPATTATDVFAFGVVLWELLLPPEQFAAMSDTSTSSVSTSSSAPAQARCGVELQAPASLPEIHPSTPKEVAMLLNNCWQREPERRPSVFQILRNWPQTFAAVGVFEMPSDLSLSSQQGHFISEVSVSTDGRDAADDEMLAAVLPLERAACNCNCALGAAPAQAVDFPLVPGSPGTSPPPTCSAAVPSSCP
eukprot:m51a1_g4269 putative serine threonine-protein kinase ctr1-like (1231) ;mRNA; r:297413-301669